jgi:cell division septum initiation protein DivIVA
MELREMTEIEDSPHEDIEKTLEKLKNENADLRKRIKQLQKENASLREKKSASEEKPNVIIEEKKPLKLFKKQKKVEEKEEIVETKEMNLEISSEFEAPSVPLSSMNKTILVGDSRRMCPSCDNTHHQSIYEETDKTHILMDYPRIYGKKYKCGKCGVEWRVPVSLE